QAADRPSEALIDQRRQIEQSQNDVIPGPRWGGGDAHSGDGPVLRVGPPAVVAGVGVGPVVRGRGGLSSKTSRQGRTLRLPGVLGGPNRGLQPSRSAAACRNFHQNIAIPSIGIEKGRPFPSAGTAHDRQIPSPSVVSSNLLAGCPPAVEMPKGR